MKTPSDKPPPGTLSSDLAQAALRVQQGDILAYPTEAVWGVGCDPANEQALEHLLALKQRPWHKGLIVVAADLSQLDDYLLPLSAEAEAMVLPGWPGPNTWLLPCYDRVSPLLRGEHQTLAVRISAHPLVQALCRQCGPLVSTSANPAGEPPALSQQQVQQYFADSVYCVPGELGDRDRPSDIRTLDGQRLR